ncbi:MAG: hypothetical protein QM536_06480 [Chitinophagaceae bacterium]|nr:hypothetical protein [Chitinophagaceae bacterium]
MKPYYLFFVLLLLQLQPNRAFSQSGIGIAVGYNYMNGPGWNQLIRNYNLLHSHFKNNQPLLQNGFFLGIEYSKEIKGHIFFSPELVYKRVSSSVENNIFNVTIDVHFLTLDLNGEIYVFEFGKRISRGFAHDFYILVGPGVSYILPQLYKDGQKEQLAGKDYTYNIVPFIGLGVGYDIYFNDKYGVSPFFRVNAYYPFKMEGLDNAILGSNPVGIDNTTYLFNFQLGVSWKYHRSGFSRKESIKLN